MNIKSPRVRKRLFAICTSILFCMGILIFNYMGHKQNKPIIIGFAAQLTGTQAELGVQARNGVQLAVETINASGGVEGRKLSLLVRDDFGVPEKAKSADTELIKEGAIAIIGHLTSSQTLAGLTVTNPAKVVMLSPTSSTPKLSAIKDYFFRIYPCFKDSSEAFAKYIYSSKIPRMAVIYDVDNSEYSKTYSTIFSNKFRSLGGNLTSELSFSSIIKPNFSEEILQLQKTKAEGLLIIASDMDTALIAQRTRLLGWNVPLFATAWAQTETLINNGGKAVEGMRLEQSYPFGSQSPRFLDFKSRYSARFGNEATFSAAYGYESALVLEEALKKTKGKAEGLNQALSEINHFNGLIDCFTVDEFGDVKRPFYLSTINNGKFTILDKLTSDNSGGE
jgi:branched-chain amino acid transport system substrate-binding protein